MVKMFSFRVAILKYEIKCKEAFVIHYMQLSAVFNWSSTCLQSKLVIITHFLMLLISGHIAHRSTIVLRLVLHFLILVQCFISMN